MLTAAIAGATAEERLKGFPSRINYKPKEQEQDFGRTETQKYSAKNVARWATTDEIAALADMQIDLHCQKRKNR